MGNEAFNVSSNLLQRIWGKLRNLELGTSPITLTGDVTGNSNANIVEKIQGKVVDNSFGDDGVLAYDVTSESIYTNTPGSEGQILSSNANGGGTKCNWINEISFYLTVNSNSGFISNIIAPYINAYVKITNSGLGDVIELDNPNLFNGKTIFIKNASGVSLNINNSDSSVTTLLDGQVGTYVCDGTNWFCTSKVTI